MSELFKDTCMVIPTKRKAPLESLLFYPPPDELHVILVSDPEVYDQHKEMYGSKYQVIRGVPGLGANKALCYNAAYEAGFPLFFRIDDDLVAKTFRGAEPRHTGNSYQNSFVPLMDVIEQCRRGLLNNPGYSLIGLTSSTNAAWLCKKPKVSKTFGILHGGATMARSVPDGTRYINPKLYRGEDVWRSCAHRRETGGWNLKLANIGFWKEGSTAAAGQTSVVATTEQFEESRVLILTEFYDMVKCEGTRWILDGTVEIPNWVARNPGTKRMIPVVE